MAPLRPAATLAPMPTPDTGPAAAPLAELLDPYYAYAARQTFADRGPRTLYDPVRYALEVGGKAVRPSLLLLAHALGGGAPDEALPAAFAVELFHNFTLVHDDIMDAAELRRGRPTVYRAFGESVAILAGDAMLIHTYGLLLDNYPAPVAYALLGELQEMAVALCEGQQRDMDMEAGAEAGYADYLEMIHGKTGVLITAALAMGAHLARLPPEAIEKIRRAGDLAGRAFQIQDDLLDTFRTSEVTGKGDYGDIVRGKQSAPYMKARELADESQTALLREVYALHDADQRRARVPEVLAVYEALGVEQHLASEVALLSLEASGLLREAGGEPAARERLIAFTEALARRGH